MTSIDIAWAAGFIEGEGCFQSRGPAAQIVVTQVQLEPLLRLQRIFGGHITRYDHVPSRTGNWNPFHRWHVSNIHARSIMMTVFVLMSPKRRTQIHKALAPWRARNVAAQHRTHCPRGHAYDNVNTYLQSNGSRRCRTCAAAHARLFYLQRRAS